MSKNGVHQLEAAVTEVAVMLAAEVFLGAAVTEVQAADFTEAQGVREFMVAARDSMAAQVISVTNILMTSTYSR